MQLNHSQPRQFGGTGLQVSPLGFGAAPAGYLGMEEDFSAMLNQMLDWGINVIDTAECYGNAEEMIGKAVAHRRDEYVLVTKCGHCAAELGAPEFSPQLVARSVDRSLQRLGTDRIDVVLLHSCSQQELERGEALNALVQARQQGKVRFVGYSGDNEAAAYATTLADVAVLQASINLCDQRNIDLALAKASRRNIAVMAKRPLANAAWKPLSSQTGLYVDYAKTYTERFATMGLDLDKQSGMSWAEIAIRFTAFVPGVHTAIVGSRRAANIWDNLQAVRKGPLPTDLVEQIRDGFANAQQRSGINWEAQV